MYGLNTNFCCCSIIKTPPIFDIYIVPNTGGIIYFFSALQYPLRVGSFLLVMYVIPWLFYRILIPWLDRRSAAAAGLALLSLMVSGIYFFYLFFAAIMAVLHKRLFYEKISGTHIVSTIAKL